MKTSFLAFLGALLVQEASSHAIFQELWVNGVDQGTTCARVPVSNTPVTSVTSTDIRCNAHPQAASGKCSVSAGGTVAVEMHQQPGDRSCANEAIGGSHYGPVTVYMTKVADAATADGSTGWFKIFEDGWSKSATGSVGDDDNWGTKDLNTCCGKMNVKIPATIASGDYLLRAEALALHTASTVGGAQFYMTCYQITVTGGGSATPATVQFPGAYKATDPGIEINIHAAMSTYVVPGPAVMAGGETVVPGNPTCPVAAAGGATAGAAGGKGSPPAGGSPPVSSSAGGYSGGGTATGTTMMTTGRPGMTRQTAKTVGVTTKTAA